MRVTLALSLLALNLGAWSTACGRVRKLDEGSEAQETSPSQGSDDETFSEVQVPPPLGQARPRWLAMDRVGSYDIISFQEPAEPEVITIEADRCVWSPGGTRLLCGETRDDASSVVTVYDAPEFQVTFRAEESEVVSSLVWHNRNSISYHVAGEDQMSRLWDLEEESSEQLASINRLVLSSGEQMLPTSSSYARHEAEAIVYEGKGELRSYYRSFEGDEFELPRFEQLWGAPNMSQLLLRNPTPVPEETSGLWGVELSDRDPSVPDCSNHHTCDIQITAPEIKGVHFDEARRFVAFVVRWSDVATLRGTREGGAEVFLATAEPDLFSEYSRYIKPVQNKGIRVGLTLEATDFSDDGKLTVAHALLDEEGDPSRSEMKIHDLATGQTEMLDWSGVGATVELLPSEDRSRWVMVNARDWKAGQADIVALIQEPEGWREQVVVELSAMTFFLGRVLRMQPDGDAFLVTVPSELRDSASDASSLWSAEYRQAEAGGYALYTWEQGRYQLKQAGDGFADFCPDGQGLIIKRDQQLFFAPLSDPALLYPLAPWEDEKRLSLPPRWPTNE